MIGTKENNNHAFSIELRSKEYLKAINVGNEKGDQVVIEGLLGDLLDVKIVEESMLQVTGSKGTLRLDIRRKEMRTLIMNETKKKGGV